MLRPTSNEDKHLPQAYKRRQNERSPITELEHDSQLELDDDQSNIKAKNAMCMLLDE